MLSFIGDMLVAARVRGRNLQPFAL